MLPFRRNIPLFSHASLHFGHYALRALLISRLSHAWSSVPTSRGVSALTVTRELTDNIVIDSSDEQRDSVLKLCYLWHTTLRYTLRHCIIWQARGPHFTYTQSEALLFWDPSFCYQLTVTVSILLAINQARLQTLFRSFRRTFVLSSLRPSSVVSYCHRSPVFTFEIPTGLTRVVQC